MRVLLAALPSDTSAARGRRSALTTGLGLTPARSRVCVMCRRCTRQLRRHLDFRPTGALLLSRAARQPASPPGRHAPVSAASRRLASCTCGGAGAGATAARAAALCLRVAVGQCLFLSYVAAALRCASARRAGGRLFPSPSTPTFLLTLLPVRRTTASGDCRVPTISPLLAKRTTWSPPDARALRTR